MSDSWNWPGSRWWRVDLHAHSPASYDFAPKSAREAADWKKWLESARDAGLDAIAVTDHNTDAGIDPLLSARSDVPKSPVLFPGVELTANDGTHLLIIFDPTKTGTHVADLLSRANVPLDERGTQTGRSSLSVEQLFDLTSNDIIILGAHVNTDTGLLLHDGQQRIGELNHPGLLGVEIEPDAQCDFSWFDGSKPEIKRVIPVLYGSDSHRYKEMGRRITWVKMTEPSIEGLRLSLLDGADSVISCTKDSSDNPNRHASQVIERITVRDSKFMGRPKPFSVDFNPWLSCIIGGRGSGKSTLVDMIRLVSRRERELDGSDNSSLRDTFDKRMRVSHKRRH